MLAAVEASAAALVAPVVMKEVKHGRGTAEPLGMIWGEQFLGDLGDADALARQENIEVLAPLAAGVQRVGVFKLQVVIQAGANLRQKFSQLAGFCAIFQHGGHLQNGLAQKVHLVCPRLTVHGLIVSIWRLSGYFERGHCLLLNS